MAFKALECWDEYHKWARTPDPRYMPESGSDNCCSAPGWICLSDENFHSGWRAFQAYGHCNPRIRPMYLPSNQYYDATDNCCHLGRQCQTSADWERGHSDFLYFKCEFSVPLIDSVPVSLTGSPKFHTEMKALFSLLKAKSPYYYDYAARGLDRIVQRSQWSPGSNLGQFGDQDSVICTGERTYYSGHTDDLPGNFWRVIVQSISRMTHEACHCNRQAAGLDQGLEGSFISGGFSAKEVPCLEQQHLVMRQVDPADTVGLGRSYAAIVRREITDFPGIAPFLEKPLSYYDHYLAVGP